MKTDSTGFSRRLLGNRWLRWLGFGIVLIVVFLQFRSYGQNFRRLADLNQPLLMAVIIPIVLIPLTLHAENWGSMLKTLGDKMPFRDVLYIYFYSSLIRYIPGTYWYIVTRTAMGVKRGQTLNNLLIGTGLELVIKVFSGIIVILVAYTSGMKLQLDQIIWIGIWLLLGMCLYIWINFTRKDLSLFQNGNSWVNLIHKPIQLLHAQPLVMGKWILIYFVSWAFQGFILWLIISIWQPLSINVIIWTTFAYTTGWIAGFLNPFTPSGFGAREAVLMAILAPIVSAPTVLGASLVMRLVILIGETILTAIGWICQNKKICRLPEQPTD